MDPQAGARPLRRLVRLHIEDAVADYLINHQGEETPRLVVELEGDRPVVKARDTVAQSLPSLESS